MSPDTQPLCVSPGQVLAYRQLAIRVPMVFPLPLRILVGFDVVGSTEVPLADHQRFISGIAQQLRDGWNRIGQNSEIPRIVNRGVSAERSGTETVTDVPPFPLLISGWIDD